MDAKYMKCTDVWEIAKKLHNHIKEELKAAIIAHGGEFSWYSEEDEEYADNAPVVACYGRYAGAVEVKIRRVYLYESKCIGIEAATNDFDDEITIELEDIIASNIQFIIESIPATDTVSDVSVPFSID